MRILNLDQDEHEWLVWRAGGLGASDASSILGVSPFKTAQQLWTEKRAAVMTKGQKVVPTEYSWAMQRGKRLEPSARLQVQRLTGIKCEPICCMHDTEDWLRASLDGYDASIPLVVEIKCPNNKAHMEAINGGVPDYYIPQLIHQSLVTGVDNFLYVSFCPDRKFVGTDTLAIVDWTITEDDREAYAEVAREFWESVLEGKPVE